MTSILQKKKTASHGGALYGFWRNKEGKLEAPPTHNYPPGGQQVWRGGVLRTVFLQFQFREIGGQKGQHHLAGARCKNRQGRSGGPRAGNSDSTLFYSIQKGSRRGPGDVQGQEGGHLAQRERHVGLGIRTSVKRGTRNP